MLIYLNGMNIIHLNFLNAILKKGLRAKVSMKSFKLMVNLMITEQ